MQLCALYIRFKKVFLQEAVGIVFLEILNIVDTPLHRATELFFNTVEMIVVLIEHGEASYCLV